MNLFLKARASARNSAFAIGGIALSAILVGSLPAHASTVDVYAKINGVQYATSGYTTVDLTLNTKHIGNVIAGPEQWTEDVSQSTLILGDANHNFTTYCIEILQDVILGHSYGFMQTSLTDAPKPGDQVIPKPVSLPWSGPMGATKAQDIRTLWALDYTNVVDKITAAAFQLAIWEIVYENTGTKWNVYDGDLTVASGAVGNKANDFLQQVSTSAPKWSNIITLTSATDQDQITAGPPVPLPASVWGGMALLGGMLVVRRVRKSQVAA